MNYYPWTVLFGRLFLIILVSSFAMDLLRLLTSFVSSVSEMNRACWHRREGMGRIDCAWRF